MLILKKKEEKMNNFRNILALLLFACFGQFSFAQPGHTSMDIIGSYRPRIPDVQKVSEEAVIQDSAKNKVAVDYELYSRKHATLYEVDPIKAANMRGELLKKIYPGYAKAGFGTYMTPYAEVFYNSTRSKKLMGGVHLKHLSSTGEIAEMQYPGFSQNLLALSGKSFLKKTAISGGLDYDRRVVHYYGITDDTLSDPKSVWNGFKLTTDSIKQRYQLIGANASIHDLYPVDSQATKFRTGISYYNFRDINNAEENNVNLNGDVSFYYRDFDLFVKGDIDYYKNNTSLLESSNTLLTLRPGIRFKQDKWHLNAGVSLFSGMGDTKMFRLAPELDFTLKLFEDFLVLNAGTDSRYERASYRKLTDENPFLINTLELRNVWKPFRWYAGLYGAVSSRLSFNLRASYVQLTDQYFYVNDTSYGNWNKLNVVYDNPSLFEFNGELAWQKHTKLRLAARVDYLGYTTSSEERAWHVPSLRLNVNGKYNLKDKIWITASIIGLNRQFARTFVFDTAGVASITEERMKGIADINLGGEYRYNKRMGIFLQLNNILNVRYSRFLNYPTQRFNVLGGVSVSF